MERRAPFFVLRMVPTTGKDSRGVGVRYPCPCCEYLTFEEEPCGTYEICPVCYWECDGVQNSDPEYDGGANGISLRKARENFAKYRAVKREFVREVRRPLPDELP